MEVQIEGYFVATTDIERAEAKMLDLTVETTGTVRYKNLSNRQIDRNKGEHLLVANVFKNTTVCSEATYPYIDGNKPETREKAKKERAESDSKFCPIFLAELHTPGLNPGETVEEDFHKLEPGPSYPEAMTEVVDILADPENSIITAYSTRFVRELDASQQCPGKGYRFGFWSERPDILDACD